MSAQPTTDDAMRRSIEAAALRAAADAWQRGGWALDLPPGQDRPAIILGMAQRAASYLRARAEAIERAGRP